MVPSSAWEVVESSWKRDLCRIGMSWQWSHALDSSPSKEGTSTSQRCVFVK